MDNQVKKTGKISDNFICLPDPEDVYTWYYVVFGIKEPSEYDGGFYFGKVTCPPDYPAKAPNIKIITENGRFRTHGEGICLSISNFHPESWNPAWKVSQIVIGLVSFWISNEYTWGAVEDYEFDSNPDLSETEQKLNYAMCSRESVLKNEKF